MRSENESTNDLPSYNLERLSVFYMEKCRHLRVVMKMMLKELGIKNIWEVSNIVDAPEYVVQKIPDLIITDWAPDFDALTFIERVRGESESLSRFTPIIISSAFDLVEHIEIARDHGVLDYLVKPSSPVDLYKRICAIIMSSRQFVESHNYFGLDRRLQTVSFGGDDRRVSQ